MVSHGPHHRMKQLQVRYSFVSSHEDYDKEKVVVTLIATGMPREKKMVREIQRPLERDLVLKDYKPVTPRKEVELIMPTFLQEANTKRVREDKIVYLKVEKEGIKTFFFDI